MQVLSAIKTAGKQPGLDGVSAEDYIRRVHQFDLGIPEFEAKRYESRLQKGGILLSVHCDTSDEINRAKTELKATGAEDVSSTGESSVDAKEVDRDAAAKAARRSY
jgi:hypothetical protein